tara:strand:- start:49601 stop:51682 length:2082 start_codon:yes stop_codon:yes gene_type:complete
MTELILTEKPSSAEKIAKALADKEPKKITDKGVAYYTLTHNKKEIIVSCAVGHLYTVGEKDKKAWTYPIFNIEWTASYSKNKASAFTKKYLDKIKELAKKADTFTVACDYDIEGEVIGLNIVRYAFKKKDASRMKFSTLTKKELIESYENKSKHLNWGQANAGDTRHKLDFIYGINLSRALTLSIKNSTGKYKLLSSGRVQGPSLKILADREKEIKSFKPVPFWQIELKAEKDKNEIVAFHKEDKFWDKKQAQKSFTNSKKGKAIVDKVNKKEFLQQPPNPFDLTALQLEAYKTLRVPPKETLQIAQSLYSNSYISYPRTSSNQLPPTINYKELIENLTKQEKYKKLAQTLLKNKTLKPNNGKKADPAHPAIYPTGEIPSKVSEIEQRLYDLIVRRTLASFSTPATRETVTIEIDLNKEIFITKGTRTTERGWHRIYAPYIMLEEQELPELNKGDELKIIKISMLDKETQPPKRYTPASIIKELEKRNLGTKATRASIVDALYQRDYVQERSLEVTDLGLKTVETLEKYCPEILDEKLTRHFEEEMEQIIEDKKQGEKVLEEAEEILTKTLEHFKENEKKIGKQLSAAHIETRDKASKVGECPNCKKDLRLIYYKVNKSFFVGCSSYPKCKTTFSLPKFSLPKPTEELCKECNFPIITMIRRGKRPYQFCINSECKTKEQYKKEMEQEASNLL